MGLRTFFIKWSVRGIARTQYRLYRLTQEKNPNVSGAALAQAIFARRVRRIMSTSAQDDRIAVYLDTKGPIRSLRDACYAIAVVEFRIDPLDSGNVSFLTSLIDEELKRLGYEDPKE